MADTTIVPVRRLQTVRINRNTMLAVFINCVDENECRGVLEAVKADPEIQTWCKKDTTFDAALDFQYTFIAMNQEAWNHASGTDSGVNTQPNPSLESMYIAAIQIRKTIPNILREVLYHQMNVLIDTKCASAIPNYPTHED